MKAFFTFIRENFKSESGQTAVEYVMMLVVVATLAMAIMKKTKAWMLAPCSVNQNSITCMLESVFNSKNLQYFPFKS
jgi:Flp pilus assembly pilin Flp